VVQSSLAKFLGEGAPKREEQKNFIVEGLAAQGGGVPAMGGRATVEQPSPRVKDRQEGTLNEKKGFGKWTGQDYVANSSRGLEEGSGFLIFGDRC